MGRKKTRVCTPYSREAALATLVLLSACMAEVEGSNDGDFPEVASQGHELTPSPELVPLVTFYSPSRGDYFSTTQTDWTCMLFASCPLHGDYRIVGLAGYVYKYTAGQPTPPGAVPLFHWWSPSRGDNFLTTDPAWAGTVGAIRLEHDGYTLFRIEGYIDTASTGGAVPLESFWNVDTRDNAAVNSRRVTMPGGWGKYRTEGYLRAPMTRAAKKCIQRAAPNQIDEPAWTVLGNFDNTWPGALFDGDALQISASGQTRVDFVGTHKNVAGEGPAGGDFLAPGEPAWSLVGRVTSGRIWVPGRGSYAANQWFPVGASSGCLEYDSQGTARGQLVLSINDNNRGDNAGGPAVVVRQYWQAITGAGRTRESPRRAAALPRRGCSSCELRCALHPSFLRAEAPANVPNGWWFVRAGERQRTKSEYRTTE